MRPGLNVRPAQLLGFCLPGTAPKVGDRKWSLLSSARWAHGRRRDIGRKWRKGEAKGGLRAEATAILRAVGGWAASGSQDSGAGGREAGDVPHSSAPHSFPWTLRTLKGWTTSLTLRQQSPPQTDLSQCPHRRAHLPFPRTHTCHTMQHGILSSLPRQSRRNKGRKVADGSPPMGLPGNTLDHTLTQR